MSRSSHRRVTLIQGSNPLIYTRNSRFISIASCLLCFFRPIESWLQVLWLYRELCVILLLHSFTIFHPSFFSLLFTVSTLQILNNPRIFSNTKWIQWKINGWKDSFETTWFKDGKHEAGRRQQEMKMCQLRKNAVERTRTTASKVTSNDSYRR